MTDELKRCMVCGEPGVFVIQPVVFLGELLMFQGHFCRPCQEKLASCRKFTVESKENGVSSVTPLGEDGQAILRQVY